MNYVSMPQAAMPMRNKVAPLLSYSKYLSFNAASGNTHAQQVVDREKGRGFVLMFQCRKRQYPCATERAGYDRGVGGKCFNAASGNTHAQPVRCFRPRQRINKFQCRKRQYPCATGATCTVPSRHVEVSMPQAAMPMRNERKWLKRSAVLASCFNAASGDAHAQQKPTWF